ncbi:MAG: nucleotidyltransferase domain-containing protein, partial [Candidatus Acidiferrales bacterium]
MISGIRDSALALACIRHGLPAVYGRGMDMLPSRVAAQFEDSFVRQLDTIELSRAFQVVVRGLLSEIRSVDEELAARLQEALARMTET